MQLQEQQVLNEEGTNFYGNKNRKTILELLAAFGDWAGVYVYFPQLSPIEPITEVGMTVLGVFIGMVYLWSTVDSIWPSLLGLLLVGFAGYVPELQGYAAVKPCFRMRSARNCHCHHSWHDFIRRC